MGLRGTRLRHPVFACVHAAETMVQPTVGVQKDEGGWRSAATQGSLGPSMMGFWLVSLLGFNGYWVQAAKKSRLGTTPPADRSGGAAAAGHSLSSAATRLMQQAKLYGISSLFEDLMPAKTSPRLASSIRHLPVLVARTRLAVPQGADLRSIPSILRHCRWLLPPCMCSAYTANCANVYSSMCARHICRSIMI